MLRLNTIKKKKKGLIIDSKLSDVIFALLPYLLTRVAKFCCFCLNCYYFFFFFFNMFFVLDQSFSEANFEKSIQNNFFLQITRVLTLFGLAF